MLPQLPSPGHLSLPMASLSGAGGNTLCSASLMHQGSGLAHQGSFSSQQQMHAMAQVPKSHQHTICDLMLRLVQRNGGLYLAVRRL